MFIERNRDWGLLAYGDRERERLGVTCLKKDIN